MYHLCHLHIYAAAAAVCKSVIICYFCFCTNTQLIDHRFLLASGSHIQCQSYVELLIKIKIGGGEGGDRSDNVMT